VTESPDGATAVRVRCEVCGPRVVTLASVRLVGRSGRWEYMFSCPDCGLRVRRSADEALRDALRDAGAAELSVAGEGGASSACAVQDA